jgi:hypothetical protein
MQAVAAIRDKHLAEQEAAEKALYADNPSAAYFANNTIPPPPGLAAANAAWHGAAASGHGPSSAADKPKPRLPLAGGATDGAQGVGSEAARTSQRAGRSTKAVAASSLRSYVAKDELVIHTLRKQQSCQQQAAGTQVPRYAGATFRAHLTLSTLERGHQALKL